MIIKCPSCKHKHDASDLTDAIRDNGNEEEYSTVVCPSCGFWLGEDEVDDEYIVYFEE